MSVLRRPVYFRNGSSGNVALQLQLDQGLYDSDTVALVGGSLTLPSGTTAVPTNRRYALASGIVVERKFQVSRTEAGITKTRSVRMLVAASKSDTIAQDALAGGGKTLNIGRQTSKSWNITRVSS